MAGSIQLSGSQQFDSQGRPLSGGLLYFFQAGTTTPQNAFQDQALAIAFPNPVVLDASGRVPFFYLADGNIKIRLTDSTGVTIITADNLLVIGPSSGGGGGGGVDATTVLATGDVKTRYGTGILSGFVRGNGRTIGSATSGATERANADCQALFEYLWNTDANLAVSGGRGGSANADWVANKTIALPDFRGRVLAGMDDMGASAAGRITGFTGTTLGNAGGVDSRTLVQGNVPSYNLSTAGLAVSAPPIIVTDPGHGHLASAQILVTAVQVPSAAGANFAAGATLTPGVSQVAQNTTTGISAALQTPPALSGTLPSGGSGTAFSQLQPTIVLTTYIKL